MSINISLQQIAYPITTAVDGKNVKQDCDFLLKNYSIEQIDRLILRFEAEKNSIRKKTIQFGFLNVLGITAAVILVLAPIVTWTVMGLGMPYYFTITLFITIGGTLMGAGVGILTVQTAGEKYQKSKMNLETYELGIEKTRTYVDHRFGNR